MESEGLVRDPLITKNVIFLVTVDRWGVEWGVDPSYTAHLFKNLFFRDLTNGSSKVPHV